MRTKHIDESVIDVLRTIEWDGNHARITAGQLDRKLYLKVNDVLASLGGKWQRKAKAHVFSDSAHDQLEAVIETGSYCSAADAKQLFGEFETPDELANEVAARATFEPGDVILEPSAGSGQLIRALVSRYDLRRPHVVAIELQERYRESLEGIADEVHCVGFLSFVPAFHADLIVMNPPFRNQADVDHVLHAYDFLADGGQLIAITSIGWTFRENAKSKRCRAFVGATGVYEHNPPLSFKSSGTPIDTLMVTLRKNP